MLLRRAGFYFLGLHQGVSDGLTQSRQAAPTAGSGAAVRAHLFQSGAATLDHFKNSTMADSVAVANDHRNR